MADSAHTVYWKNSTKITPVYSLTGYSRAKEATGFYCPELEMAFDAGVPMNDVPAYICLTHLHNDHVSCLNKMLIENKKNPIIFIPNNNKFEHLLVNMLRYIYLSSKFIHPDSDKGKDPGTKYPYQIIKLDVGQSHKFRETNSGAFYVEGLPSDHGVMSLSFGVYEMRRRCKEGYQSLEKSKYAELKAQGIDFYEYYKFPIICFMSDTNIKPLNDPVSPIFQYPTIVLECTFLEPEDLPHAKKKNHIHWNQLEPIVKTHSNKFILTHFSKKYTWNDIKHFFNKYFEKNKLPTDITIWLYSGPIVYKKNDDDLTKNLNNLTLI